MVLKCLLKCLKKCLLQSNKDLFCRLLMSFILIPTTKYAKISREKRSEFAKIYQIMIQIFENVIFSNDTKINLFGANSKRFSLLIFERFLPYKSWSLYHDTLLALRFFGLLFQIFSNSS